MVQCNSTILLQASEREKLIVGRIVVVSLVAFGIIWLPLIDSKLTKLVVKSFCEDLVQNGAEINVSGKLISRVKQENYQYNLF